MNWSALEATSEIFSPGKAIVERVSEPCVNVTGMVPTWVVPAFSFRRVRSTSSHFASFSLGLGLPPRMKRAVGGRRREGFEEVRVEVRGGHRGWKVKEED